MATYVKNVDSVVGSSIFVFLDTEANNGEGIVKYYDTRYKGDAPRGSQGQGFTIDGQFISAVYPAEFRNWGNRLIDLDGMIPSWKIPADQARLLGQWLHACYRGEDRPFPRCKFRTV